MRWRGTCAYDGTDFYGWQSQTCGRTIQDFLEKRLALIFKRPIRIHGSGRTDSGVHAKSQTFHFDAEWVHSPQSLLKAFRSGLPSTIQVRGLRLASSSFHARYCVKGKRYTYKICLGPVSPFEARYCWALWRDKIEIAPMQEAAHALLGKWDFSAFGAKHGEVEGENPVKDLWRLTVTSHGPRLCITTEASGYLYKMVRRLVGALVAVGAGKLSTKELLEIRDAKVRTPSILTAPARGLCLEKVFY